MLEALRPEHAETMLAGLSDPAGCRFIPDEPPQSIEDLRERYIRQSAGRSPDGSEIWLNWVVYLQSRINSAPIGYTQATIRGHTCLLGYHIFPQYWRRVLGSLAAQRTINILAKRRDIKVLQTSVDTRHLTSIALLRKLNFIEMRTIIAADYFKGTQSDELEFMLPSYKWCRS